MVTNQHPLDFFCKFSKLERLGLYKNYIVHTLTDRQHRPSLGRTWVKIAHMLAKFQNASERFVLCYQGCFNLSVKYEHLPSISCGQKIENLNNLETFILFKFFLALIIANLTCRADAQVHIPCYNKFRSKAESCN